MVNDKKETGIVSKDFKDMTAEEKLAVLEDIINSIPFEVWYKDAMGRYVYVNDTFAVGAGRSRNECIGQLDYEIFGDKEAVRYRQADWEFLFGEEKGGAQFNSVDGRPSLEFKKSVNDAEGAYKGIIGCDIGTRVKDLYRFFMQDESSIFRKVFDGLPFGIAIYRAGEPVPYMVNDSFCNILGVSEFTVKNTDWRLLTHPDDVEANEAPLEDFRTGLRMSFTMKKRFVKPDGEVVWTKMTVMKMEVNDGEEISICVLYELEPEDVKEGSGKKEFYYE